MSKWLVAPLVGGRAAAPRQAQPLPKARAQPPARLLKPPACLHPAALLQARFANATNVNWIAAWLACSGWQFAFVQQTPGGMWLAFVLILTALLAMGRALLQLYRWLAAATARSMLAFACGCWQVMKGSTRACCGA